jgi:hypothetical protein
MIRSFFEEIKFRECAVVCQGLKTAYVKTAWRCDGEGYEVNLLSGQASNYSKETEKAVCFGRSHS